MKKNKIILLAVLILLVLSMISACMPRTVTKNILDDTYTKICENELVGEWKLESLSDYKLEKITLYEDKTCSVNGEMGTWKIDGDKLFILGSYEGRFSNADSIVGNYTCDDDVLKIFAHIDGRDAIENLVYKKVK